MIRKSFLALCFVVFLPLAARAAPDLGPYVPCNGVPPVGCCEGETLKFCLSGTLKTRDCSGEPRCGWSAQKMHYSCGTGGAEDNKYPKACPAQPPDAGPAGGDAGADAGSAKETGDDGCSFAAGARPPPGLALVLLLAIGVLVRRGG